MNKLPERLKLLRKENNYNQKHVAKYLNLAISSYSGYENGVYEPGIDSLIKLANLYNVTTDYLLGHIDSKLSPDELLLISELELTNEELMKKYIITVDNEELPVETLLQIIDAARSLKELAASLKKLDRVKELKNK